jgi:hypothetical protein
MDDYITKPIRSDALAETLARWLVPDVPDDDGAGGERGPRIRLQAGV